jgi:hypothetical protein
MQQSPFKHTCLCWICGHTVELETCKTDENGMAVHENCYVLKVALAKESNELIAAETRIAVFHRKVSQIG